MKDGWVSLFPLLRPHSCSLEGVLQPWDDTSLHVSQAPKHPAGLREQGTHLRPRGDVL